MAILHCIFSAPPRLAQVLEYCAPDDSILFLEDGVYHLATNTLNGPTSHHNYYTILADCQARGIENNANQIHDIDYDGFVTLVCQHDKTISWR